MLLKVGRYLESEMGPLNALVDIVIKEWILGVYNMAPKCVAPV